MNILFALGICVVLVLLLTRALDFMLEQLAKFLLVLHVPGRFIASVFQILDLSTPAIVLCIFFVASGAQRLAMATILSYAIFSLIGSLIWLSLRPSAATKDSIRPSTMAILLFGGVIIAVAAINGQVLWIEGAGLLVLFGTYLATTFAMPVSTPLSHKTEMSFGRIFGLIVTAILAGAITWATGYFLIQTSTTLRDTSLIGALLLALLLCIPVLLFVTKHRSHPQVAMHAVSHNVIIVLFGLCAILALIGGSAVVPFATTTGIFLIISIASVILVSKEILTLSKTTAVIFTLLLVLYVVKILALA